METAHVAGRRTLPPGRRTLPPVPLPVAVADRAHRPSPPPAAAEPDTARAPQPARGRRVPADADAAQRFVARLRAAAPAFAAAAGARSAVVPEAVPPARHRRARCRVVLRCADGEQIDMTFLGPAAGPRGHLPATFDEQIQEWLAEGRPRDHAWLVVDPDAAGGIAVDLTAWTARR